MTSERLTAAINEQIKNELYSGYLYLAMAAYAEGQNLPGFAHWFKNQAAEEQAHAMRLFEHLVDRGARVELQAIDAPPVEFAGPAALFEQTLEHERKVTGLIHELYALALEQKDYAAQVMLQWFVSEQVEEEKTADSILQQLRLAGDRGHALLMLDHVLSQR